MSRAAPEDAEVLRVRIICVGLDMSLKWMTKERLGCHFNLNLPMDLVHYMSSRNCQCSVVIRSIFLRSIPASSMTYLMRELFQVSLPSQRFQFSSFASSSSSSACASSSNIFALKMWLINAPLFPQEFKAKALELLETYLMLTNTSPFDLIMAREFSVMTLCNCVFLEFSKYVSGIHMISAGFPL